MAMYNVLEKLRAGLRIEGKDREIHDQGPISILREVHDQITRHFHRVQSRSVQPHFVTLTALDQARLTDTGRDWKGRAGGRITIVEKANGGPGAIRTPDPQIRSSRLSVRHSIRPPSRPSGIEVKCFNIKHISYN
ncbi:MAG: hypothetical protein HC844_01230 [Tabrizicola sp.]|nr:hypothetical protein [Tabrizicola sp.]